MGVWIADNWFNVLSAGGIVGSLLFAAISLRSEAKTRRIANLLTLTQNHREMWSEIFNHPELARVLKPSAKLAKRGVTENEELYVGMVIQHLSAAYRALKDDLAVKPDALNRDIRLFFSLPIPRTVWEGTRILQNIDFREFVDACLADE